MRKRYEMGQEEIDTLVSAIISKGSHEIYNIMKLKALFASESQIDVDEKLLDMSEKMLELGRSEDKSDNDTLTKNIFYTLSFILRKLAHELNVKYLKENANREKNSRFLTLVSINNESPNTMI